MESPQCQWKTHHISDMHKAVQHTYISQPPDIEAQAGEYRNLNA